MLFKNPLLLYGLLFLLIPIIVHLFQLRKFKKVPFSNVAFLKPLITQTRKSRTLKKWLTLIARLLAVACIVIAFAQPFFITEDQARLDENLIIYLDNSHSLQAKGVNGQLYQAAVNELIEKLPSQLTFSLFTNDRSFQNVTKQEIANDLLTDQFSSTQLTPDQILLKAKSLVNKKDTKGSMLWISDFQRLETGNFPVLENDWNARFVKLKPTEVRNISIDTAFMKVNDAGDSKIQLSLKSNVDIEQPITVSLFNSNVLLAKTSASLEENTALAEFAISNVEGLNGYLQVEDDGLQFDNRLYISMNAREKIKVLHVNDTDTDFLKRIYTDDEFDYTVTSPNSLNYNSIKDQQVVVINELKSITPALAAELNNFTNAGNTLIVIPAGIAQGYNLLAGIENVTLAKSEKRITGINFDHPILRDVFSKRVTNFQYPKVYNTSFNLNNGNTVLLYDDNSAFLTQRNNTYIFTAALNEENSNFQNSPLVVPVFYKIGLKNTSAGNLYYSLNQRNEINVLQKMEEDEVLELQLEEQRYIPEQRAFNTFVTLNTNAELSIAGNYNILKGESTIGQLSFNTSRKENLDDYYTDDELGSTVSSSVTSFVQEIEEESNQTELWKFFVAAALFFLLCEVLILKFLK